MSYNIEKSRAVEGSDHGRSGADVGMCGALDSVWSRAIGGGQIFHQGAVNVYIVL